MAFHLSEAEKQVFTTSAASFGIAQRFLHSENQQAFLQNISSPVDEYLEFLNIMHEMFDHQPTMPSDSGGNTLPL